MAATDTFWGLPDPGLKPEFYADVPTKRLFAWLVDTAIIALLCLLIIPFTAFTALFFLPLLYLVVGFVYRTITLASGSATPGMRLMAVEFRARDGQKFDLQLAALHTLGYSISVAMAPAQIVSVALMLTTARGQGLTDMVLGTVAINRASRAR